MCEGECAWCNWPVVLQLKKEVAYIQPPTQPGVGSQLSMSFDRILEVARTVPEAEIVGWDDIDRLDVRPSKGMVKVRGKNRWEIQIDTQTGEVLQVAVRRSDLIESIHDGSYFHGCFKLWIFLPAGLILASLVITGAYLFLMPHLAKRKRRKNHAWQRDSRRLTTECGRMACYVLLYRLFWGCVSS